MGLGGSRPNSREGPAVRASAVAALVLAVGLRGHLAFYAHFAGFFLAGPAPRTECGEGPGFGWCVSKPPAGQAEDPGALVYFFHYAGGDERSFTRTMLARAFFAEFARAARPAPRVVAVSPGPYWNLFDEPGPEPGGGLFASFTGVWLPWLEARLGLPKRRYVWGLSQGGLNASVAVLKRPELWSAALMSCPGWFSVSVYAEPPAVDAYVARTRADLRSVLWAMGIIRARTAGPEAFHREDPLSRVAEGRLPERLPPLFVAASSKDEYGFHEGARLFVSGLLARGARVTFQPERGPHCAVDAAAAARFLMRIPVR